MILAALTIRLVIFLLILLFSIILYFLFPLVFAMATPLVMFILVYRGSELREKHEIRFRTWIENRRV